MDIADLQGKMVAVLGFGVEGRATAKYLLKHGLNPVLFDERPWQDWSVEEQQYIKNLGINFIFGPGYLKELKGFEVLFRSPGIKLTDVQKSITPGAVITSQAKWFFEHCPAPIIGVTGTKGKGTTCTLIYNIISLSLRATRSNPSEESRLRLLQSDALLRNDRANVDLVGNIGETQPLEILDNLSSSDLIVYELSSFQLQDLTQSPHIGVVLMVTSEHLDYHKDVDEYRQAKEAIVKFQGPQDFAIYNEDYEASKNIGELGQGQKIIVGDKTNFPFDVSKIQLKGIHNQENIKAAVAAVKALGIDDLAIEQAVYNFKGLAHRLEFVAEKNGIKFYNDSFSTTPETAVAAIKAFSEPEIVILGGSSKNSDFTDLGATILKSKNIKVLILIGQEAGRIEQSLQEKFSAQILRGAQNMAEIFAQIKTVAAAGDIVLLTPACASFGMFKNYKDRGQQFKQFVYENKN